MLDRRPLRRPVGGAVAPVLPLEVVVVDELAAQVGEVLVDPEQHLVDLALGVVPAGLEPAHHLEQHGRAHLAPRRHALDPSVGEQPGDQPFLLGARGVVRLALERGTRCGVALTGLRHPRTDDLLEVAVPGHSSSPSTALRPQCAAAAGVDET